MKEKLEAQLKDATDRFNKLEEKRQALIKTQNEYLTEQLRIQGEVRQINKLLDILKETP